MENNKGIFNVEELERLASDESIVVPEGFGDEIAGMIDSLDAAERIVSSEKMSAKRILTYTMGAAAGIALLVGVGLSTLRPPVLEDTFTDPALAYAEVEKALTEIAARMNPGVDRAAVAGREIEAQAILLNNLYNNNRQR